MDEQTLRDYYNDHVMYDSVPSEDIEIALLRLRILALDTVLDLGCGDGRLAKVLTNSKITGIDYSDKRIEQAKKRHKSQVWVCSSVRDWLEADVGVYSLVTMFEVLEHVEDPAGLVRMARECGPVLASVPVNWPDPAHLHVWKDETEMVRDLAPDRHIRVNERWFCTWGQT